MKKNNPHINIPDKQGGLIRVSEKEFLERFPTEKSYLEYLTHQPSSQKSYGVTANEITPIEMLNLSRFIYDEPDRESIPLLDIGQKIYTLTVKLQKGIETSQKACTKIKTYLPDIPCTPYPEEIFWAKLKDVKPLQFLESSFDETVSVDDAIQFCINEKEEFDSKWAVHIPILAQYAQQKYHFSIETPLVKVNNDEKIEASEFKEIMRPSAALKFLRHVKSDKIMQVFISEWEDGKNKLSLCGLIYHLFDHSFLFNAKGGNSERAVLNAAKRFFQKKYDIDIHEEFRKGGRRSEHKLPFKDLKNY